MTKSGEEMIEALITNRKVGMKAWNVHCPEYAGQGKRPVNGERDVKNMPIWSER